MTFGTSLDLGYFLKVQGVLISSGIIHNSNSSQTGTAEKISQLSVHRQESSLCLCDAGAMLLPLSYEGSWQELAWLD